MCHLDRSFDGNTYNVEYLNTISTTKPNAHKKFYISYLRDLLRLGNEPPSELPARYFLSEYNMLARCTMKLNPTTLKHPTPRFVLSWRSQSTLRSTVRVKPQIINP